VSSAPGQRTTTAKRINIGVSPNEADCVINEHFDLSFANSSIAMKHAVLIVVTVVVALAPGMRGSRVREAARSRRLST
jgi:hypothetical protein